MNTLIPLKDLIDSALLGFANQKTRTYIEHIFIIVRRLRKNWEYWCDDFVNLLKKIEKSDPNFYCFAAFMNFLTEKFNEAPFKKLLDDLNSKGYNQEAILSISLTSNEIACIARIPSNIKAINWALFFLYQPRLTIKYFTETLFLPLSDQEKKLLENYQKLSFDIQRKISESMYNLALHSKSDKKE